MAKDKAQYTLRYKVKTPNGISEQVECIVETIDVGEAINNALKKYVRIFDVTISTLQCPLCKREL